MNFDESHDRGVWVARFTPGSRVSDPNTALLNRSISLLVRDRDGFPDFWPQRVDFYRV